MILSRNNVVKNKSSSLRPCSPFCDSFLYRLLHSQGEESSGLTENGPKDIHGWRKEGQAKLFPLMFHCRSKTFTSSMKKQGSAERKLPKILWALRYHSQRRLHANQNMVKQEQASQKRSKFHIQIGMMSPENVAALDEKRKVKSVRYQPTVEKRIIKNNKSRKDVKEETKLNPESLIEKKFCLTPKQPKETSRPNYLQIDKNSEPLTGWETNQSEDDSQS